MKNKLTFTGAAAGVAMAGLFIAIVPALAASAVVLGHAGIGQKAGDTANFGVAICDNGTQATAGAVPFAVTANGKTVSATVSGPLAAGACQYTYLAYSSFGMTSGSSYSVTVTIDPNQTVTTNVAAPANYMLTVPGPVGQVLGASTVVPNASASGRASQLAQLANLEAILQQLLAKLASMGK